MRVPSSWSRRATLPPFDSLERRCTSTLPEDVTLAMSGERLTSRQQVNEFFWRDPLPYAMDLSDALVDLSQTGLPPWQEKALITAAPPWPPPPPPPPGAPPRPAVDEADYAAWATHQRHEWFVRYARDSARRRVIRVSDGWLVGFNGGENGGSLWWYPQTPGPGRLMWRGNVSWLEPVGVDVVAIGGLARASSRGSPCGCDARRKAGRCGATRPCNTRPRRS